MTNYRASTGQTKVEIRRFAELSTFIRKWLEATEQNVRQAAMFLHPIKESRLYDVVEGRRAFDGWEVAHFAKRTNGIIIPASYLRGEDRYGRQVKKRPINQKLMEQLLKEAEQAS